MRQCSSTTMQRDNSPGPTTGSISKETVSSRGYEAPIKRYQTTFTSTTTTTTLLVVVLLQMYKVLLRKNMETASKILKIRH